MFSLFFSLLWPAQRDFFVTFWWRIQFCNVSEWKSDDFCTSIGFFCVQKSRRMHTTLNTKISCFKRLSTLAAETPPHPPPHPQNSRHELSELMSVEIYRLTGPSKCIFFVPCLVFHLYKQFHLSLETISYCFKCISVKESPNSFWISFCQSVAERPKQMHFLFTNSAINSKMKTFLHIGAPKTNIIPIYE